MSQTNGLLAPTTALRPGDILDTYATDDGMVVLVAASSGHRVVRLSPLGRAVHSAVDGGRTLAELEVALVSELGEPTGGDVSELVRRAVVDLVREGVIVAGQKPKDDISGDRRR